MPRSRRRRRRSGSGGRRGRTNPLTLAVALLVLAGLWVVGGEVLDSLPPGISRSLPDLHAPDISIGRPGDDGGRPGDGSGGSERPGADDLAANTRAIRRLGGSVDYGTVDRVTGQRSGIVATITPRMVAAAARDQVGSEPEESIRPPGFDRLPSRNRARGHLLGRQLGGSGQVASNLVALYQERANSPVMRDYETMVADAVRDGQTVRYRVRPLYAGGSDRGAPRAVRLQAVGDHGFRLDVEIANTPRAPVKVAVGPAR
ncbi:MAG TPA: DNA/RNA non-specific endonuclease [Actinomycetes bacterium]|nr:DNA/RNA non-specific endonuclease [Actinomycetes bacterium]